MNKNSSSACLIEDRLRSLRAASILIGLVGFFALITPSTVTNAQVIGALSEVKTIHAVGQWFYGDAKDGTNEIWYQRGVALKLVSANKNGGFTAWSDGKQIIRIEDPKFGERAPEIHAVEEDNEAMLAKELTLDGLRDHVQPDASGDREIDGVKCRLFVWRRQPWGRTCYWIDPANLVRRMEMDDVNTQTNQWKARLIADFSYNLPIDPQLLKMPEMARAIAGSTTNAH